MSLKCTSVKQNIIEVTGKVTQLLSNANFRVRLENGYDIIAYICGRIKKNKIKVLVGDKVIVNMSIHDPRRGRIIHRY